MPHTRLIDRIRAADYIQYDRENKRLFTWTQGDPHIRAFTPSGDPAGQWPLSSADPYEAYDTILRWRSLGETSAPDV